MRTPPETVSENRPGRTICLDVGTKTIGVAVSDELGICASGVGTIRRRNQASDIAELEKMAKKYRPREVVVGIPFGRNGSLGAGAKRIKSFSRRVADSLELPVRYWDESFSTKTAERVLVNAGMGRKKRKRVIDKMAATVILDEYLRSRKQND